MKSLAVLTLLLITAPACTIYFDQAEPGPGAPDAGQWVPDDAPTVWLDAVTPWEPDDAHVLDAVTPQDDAPPYAIDAQPGCGLPDAGGALPDAAWVPLPDAQPYP